MANKLLAILFFSAAVLVFSCSRYPDPVTRDGIISGYAGLYPSYKDDSILVTARGPYGKTKVTTDSKGLYKFSGVGNGTYTITYSKQGYGSISQYGVQMFGNDSIALNTVTLFKRYDSYKIPEIERVLTGPMPRSSLTNCLILKTEQKLGYFPLLFFLSINNSVDYRNHDITVANYNVRGPFETPNFDVIYIDLNILPFTSGEKVYVIGYVCNLDEYRYGFFDRYYGKEVLSTMMPDNHTPVIEFIMP